MNTFLTRYWNQYWNKQLECRNLQEQVRKSFHRCTKHHQKKGTILKYHNNLENNQKTWEKNFQDRRYVVVLQPNRPPCIRKLSARMQIVSHSDPFLRIAFVKQHI